MSDSPAVTIITPTWNRCGLLQECIDSVRAQSFSNWEHLVIDDRSDDGTVELVKALSKQEPRIRLRGREGERGGANVCRNQALQASRGEYVIFLDSDDLLEPSCLERRVELLTRNLDLDFATFQTGYFVEEVGDRRQEEPEEVFGDDLLRFLSFDLPWIISGPIWRRSSLTRLGGFDEELPSWQDVDLHIRAICSGLKYLRLPEIDHHVRWQFEETKVSVQQRRCPQHLAAAECTIEKFERTLEAGPGLDWSRQRALCGLYFFLAERWVDANDCAAALRCWRRIRERGLGPRSLYLAGVSLLYARRIPGWTRLIARLTHKWQGKVRFRVNPELVKEEHTPKSFTAPPGLAREAEAIK